MVCVLISCIDAKQMSIMQTFSKTFLYKRKCLNFNVYITYIIYSYIAYIYVYIADDWQVSVSPDEGLAPNSYQVLWNLYVQAEEIIMDFNKDFL